MLHCSEIQRIFTKSMQALALIDKTINYLSMTEAKTAESKAFVPTCDGSNLTAKLNIKSSNVGSSSSINSPQITLTALKRFKDDFVIIDCRETSEFDVNKYPETLKTTVTNVPMGKLLSNPYQKGNEGKKLLNSKDKLCLICGSGSRATTAAADLISKAGYNAYSLIGGVGSFKQKWSKKNDWIWYFLNIFQYKINTSILIIPI